MSDVLKKLLSVQAELKAPKNQFNKFGGYNYRSCEDILEAVKPLCQKYGCVVTLSDELLCNGSRYHINARARFYDTESGEFIENSALAREAEQKKGMDDSQITGTASSYARKYALNGLFCIDDTKDADTDEYKRNIDAKASSKPTDAPERIVCKKCGAAIQGGKNAQGVFRTPAEIAQNTGGMCVKCYKGSQK